MRLDEDFSICGLNAVWGYLCLGEGGVYRSDVMHIEKYCWVPLSRFTHIAIGRRR